MLPKMRTLPEAAKELKDHDPNTHLTYAVLRRLVRNGLLRHVKSGSRILINLADLENLAACIPDPTPGKIRRVGGIKGFAEHSHAREDKFNEHSS